MSRGYRVQRTCCFDSWKDMEGTTDPLTSMLPRSIDVRVWVTRPHLTVVEFPMSQKSSALMLEGERGLYYRWQRVAMPEVMYGARLWVYSMSPTRAISTSASPVLQSNETAANRVYICCRCVWLRPVLSPLRCMVVR